MRTVDLTPERIARYSGDPILFNEDQFLLPETRKPIQYEQWQKDWILKPLFYDLDENGQRKYNIAVLGMPKKNGKSSFAASIGVYFIFCDDPMGEIIIAANDKEQASMIIYTKIRQSIGFNSALKRGVLLMKTGIEVKSDGTLCRCLAHQAESAAGLNPNLTLFDELWGFRDRKFYDELMLSPARANPLVLIVTYAGYEEEGLLWDLYQDGMAGDTILDTGLDDVFVKRGQKDTGMFFFWSHRNLASWVTDKYLEKQRRRLPAPVYLRFHENRWVPGGTQTINESDIERMYAVPWEMQLGANPEKPFSYVVATDLGLTHDRTARAVGHYDPTVDKIFLDNLRIWQGTPTDHVSIASVEEDLKDCSSRFATNKLVVDPWQMESTIQKLKPNYNVVPFSFQANIWKLSHAVVNVIQSGRLVAYPGCGLEDELRRLVIKTSSRGWRIDHGPGHFSDKTIAIGMMVLELIRSHFGAGTELEDSKDDKPIGMDDIFNKEF